MPPPSLGKSYDLDMDALADEDDRAAMKSKMPASGNPMDAEVGGTPFKVLMDQAVKMKTADQAIFRSKFDSWPRFYQNSVFANDIVKDARSADFAGMMEAAEKLKKTGNEAFSKQDFMAANHCYEQAVSIFKYAENVDPNWKDNGKGMRDDSLVKKSYECKGEEEEGKVRDLMKSCYLNISLNCQKMAEHDIAIQACDCVLELDPASSKALFRRAMSRIAPKSSGGLEQDLALKDLIKASDNSPGDKTVAKELRALREKIKSQKVMDKKTFTGMFGRGEVYTREEEELVRERLAKAERDQARKKVMGEGEEDTLERRMYEAEALYNVYMKQERFKEAEELKEKIDSAKKAKTKIDKESGGKGAKDINIYGEGADFDNPTEAMIKDAKERGIDLKDPRVKDMLKRLKQEKEAGKEPGLRSYDAETKGKLMEMVKDMGGRELRECLGEMEVVYEEGEGDKEMRERFVKALMEGKKIPEGWKPTPRISGFTQKVLEFLGTGSRSWWGNFRVSVLCLVMMILYRVITKSVANGPRVRVPYVEEIVRDESGVSVMSEEF